VIDETLLEAEVKMDKAVEVAKEEFATIRTGRANAAMFSKIMVDYYGSPTPLQQLASFQTPEARVVVGEAGEDEVQRAEKELEQVTKRHVELIDDVLRHKESELLEV